MYRPGRRPQRTLCPHPPPSRTFRTIEIGFGQHLANPFVDFMNHSCDPNTVLDVDRLAFVALRDVRAATS